MLEFLSSIIAGIITSLGLGGGTILIIILTIFMSVEQKTAQASNLVFFIPTSTITSIINIKNKAIDFKIAIPIIIAGTIMSIIGAYISTIIDTSILKKMFSAFLIFIATYEIYNLKKKKK